MADLSEMFPATRMITIDEWADDEAWSWLEQSGWVATPALLFAMKQHVLDLLEEHSLE